MSVNPSDPSSSVAPARRASRALRIVAWSCVGLSWPVWGAAFVVVPFLPLAGRTRVVLAAACIAAGEVLFWGAGLVLGADAIAFVRRWLASRRRGSGAFDAPADGEGPSSER